MRRQVASFGGVAKFDRGCLSWRNSHCSRRRLKKPLVGGGHGLMESLVT